MVCMSDEEKTASKKKKAILNREKEGSKTQVVISLWLRGDVRKKAYPSTAINKTIKGFKKAV